jgi:acetoin utilization deacetylase AcuC-like enzyme
MTSQVQNNLEKMPGYLLDDRYLLHNPGTQHPESPQRLIAIRQMLEASGITRRWNSIPSRSAAFNELELIHSPAYIKNIERAAQRAPTNLDLDTQVSTESYQTAILAAGGVFQCIDSICSEKLRRIFAFIRPPGHHAGRDHARGFCLFNNVALAAAYARKEHKLSRIAIVDFDVHHGDGTQSCFYTDPDVLYISTHQYPFYPGSGNFTEAGQGEGKGYTLNLPLPRGTGDSDFIPIYSKIISPVLDQFAPELIMVSAGFDGHFSDPLGELSLTQAGYASAAASLMLAAERSCNGKICFVLEGGYDMQALQDSILAILVEMEKKHPCELAVPEGAFFKEILKQPEQFAAGRWKW